MTQPLAEKDADIKGQAPVAASGFVMPGMEAGENEANAIDPRKKRKKRDGDFLAMLAAYYSVERGYFDTLTAKDGITITPFLDAFTALNQPQSRDEALVAQNALGSQTAFDIRPDSVMSQKGVQMSMRLAIDMALAAKANPAFANGVDVAGNAEERAMLLAAAELVGLTVLNANKVKPDLLQQYRSEAAQEWAALKDLVTRREQFEHEDTVSVVPEKPVNDKSQSETPDGGGMPGPAATAVETPPTVADALDEAAKSEEAPVASMNETPDFDSLPPEQQQKVKDFFRLENKAKPDITDREIAERWSKWPLSVRRRAFTKDFNSSLVKAVPQDVAAPAPADETDTPRTVPEKSSDIVATPVVEPAAGISAPVAEIVDAEIVPSAEEKEIVPVGELQKLISPDHQTQNVEINFVMMPPKAEKDDFGKDAPPVAVAFTQAKLPQPQQLLLIEQKKSVAEILEEGGVDHDLYALVRFRVTQDNDARVKHVEDIIGFDNNTEGSTKKARVILKALEAEGVVVQEYPRGPRRVVHPEDRPQTPRFDNPGPG